MNTPSHFIMTAAARKAFPRLNMVRSAVYLGSVAPDIPLYLLSFGGIFYFRTIEGWSTGEAARHVFDTLYFEDPGWIASHNFLHSLVVLTAGLFLCRAVQARRPKLSEWLRWFLLACLLHTIVDIGTHGDDGPILFWPISWTFRIYSPISYWDANYYGREFFVFETIFDLALTAYLVVPWLRRRMARRNALNGGES